MHIYCIFAAYVMHMFCILYAYFERICVYIVHIICIFAMLKSM